MHDLTFGDVHFEIIEQDGQAWISGPQIGEALGYAKPAAAILKIYRSHADEFTPAMTRSRPTHKGADMRIFSFRGAHLIALFAKSARAKEFRRWVLDVLEGRAGRAPAAPSVDIRELMLGQLNLPAAPIPDEVAKALEARAWALASEAKDICHEHLLRRVAYEAQFEHPELHIDVHKALQAISRGGLDEALTYYWTCEVRTLRSLVECYVNLGKRLVDELAETGKTPRKTAISSNGGSGGGIRPARDTLGRNRNAGSADKLIDSQNLV